MCGSTGRDGSARMQCSGVEEVEREMTSALSAGRTEGQQHDLARRVAQSRSRQAGRGSPLPGPKTATVIQIRQTNARTRTTLGMSEEHRSAGSRRTLPPAAASAAVIDDRQYRRAAAARGPARVLRGASRRCALRRGPQKAVEILAQPSYRKDHDRQGSRALLRCADRAQAAVEAARDRRAWRGFAVGIGQGSRSADGQCQHCGNGESVPDHEHVIPHDVV